MQENFKLRDCLIEQTTLLHIRYCLMAAQIGKYCRYGKVINSQKKLLIAGPARPGSELISRMRAPALDLSGSNPFSGVPPSWTGSDSSDTYPGDSALEQAPALFANDGTFLQQFSSGQVRSAAPTSWADSNFLNGDAARVVLDPSPISFANDGTFLQQFQSGQVPPSVVAVQSNSSLEIPSSSDTFNSSISASLDAHENSGNVLVGSEGVKDSKPKKSLLAAFSTKKKEVILLLLLFPSEF